MNRLRATKYCRFFFAIILLLFLGAGSFAQAQRRRKVIVNEDFSGPGGSNLQTLLLMI